MNRMNLRSTPRGVSAESLLSCLPNAVAETPTVCTSETILAPMDTAWCAQFRDRLDLPPAVCKVLEQDASMRLRQHEIIVSSYCESWRKCDLDSKQNYTPFRFWAELRLQDSVLHALLFNGPKKAVVNMMGRWNDHVALNRCIRQVGINSVAEAEAEAEAEFNEDECQSPAKPTKLAKPAKPAKSATKPAKKPAKPAKPTKPAKSAKPAKPLCTA
jgi:hypothetical protein